MIEDISIVPVRWTRTQLKRLCEGQQSDSRDTGVREKTFKKGKSKEPVQSIDLPTMITTPPPSDEDLPEEEKWRDYINKFTCDVCGQAIRDFRLYCRYCERSHLDEWSYESYDLCPPCFQRFPHHPHPREAFVMRNVAEFDRDTSEMIPDGYWEGALLESSAIDGKCGFCHEGASEERPFIGEKPFLRLRKSELTEPPSSHRDYFHRPYFFVHLQCAKYSPETYYSEKLKCWFNVAVALHRGRSLKCSLCKRSGATVGCMEYRCERSFHVSCTNLSDAVLKDGSIFWCPAHDRIKQGTAEYDDIWSCDNCNTVIGEGGRIHSCGACRDYYSSYDLCSECWNGDGDWEHHHQKDQFFVNSIAKEQLIREDTLQINPERSRGPALCDIYSMDYTSTALDVHGRAPRWASHNSSDFSGTWLPQIPRWALLKYTQPGDMVLSNFLGRGTDAVECLLLGRPVIAVDVNKQCLGMAIRNCTVLGETMEADIRLGDATSLDGIHDRSFKLVLSHPPYYRCIQYSSGVEASGDLSRCTSLTEFALKMGRVAQESWRVLQPGGHVALGMGDNRESRLLLPVVLWTAKAYLEAGFVLEEYIVKRQRCCAGTTKGMSLSTMFGFLLLTHEIILVLRKRDKQECNNATLLLTRNITDTISVVGTSTSGRRSCQGTIWVVPEDCRDIRFYINDNFQGLYGIAGTLCRTISGRSDYEGWLPLGPFRTATVGEDEEDRELTEYERRRLANIKMNRHFMLTQSASKALPSPESKVISLLIIEPDAIFCGKEIESIFLTLPSGAHVVVGARDFREAGQYQSVLFKMWQELAPLEQLTLKEIVYVMSSGWTRHPRFYTPIVSNVDEWRPSTTPLDIVHLAYLVYRIDR